MAGCAFRGVAYPILGLTHSLELRPPVGPPPPQPGPPPMGPPPQQGPARSGCPTASREVSEEEEEADPSVPFPHGAYAGARLSSLLGCGWMLKRAHEPMQWRPKTGDAYGGAAKVGQCGGLRPPRQQAMDEPCGGQTLAHMLRMTGELRAEGGVPPAKAAADLGLRQVPRPQTMTVSAASRSAAGTPGDNVEVMAKMVT